MKYLNDYLNPMLTSLMVTHGAFFAFSPKQFEEQRVVNIKYQSLGNGLMAPVENAFRLAMDIDVKYKEAIEEDIAENGIDAIVKRELLNHEAYYTMDIEETVNVLKDYGVDEDAVLRIFRAELTKVSML